MKWSPQPKDPCARPDCDKPARQWTFCVNHSHLYRRNGVPYTQEELDDQRAGNKYEREMDEALAADPPVIDWVLDQRTRVLVPAYIYDPHADHPNRKPRRRKGLRPIDVEYLGEVS